MCIYLYMDLQDIVGRAFIIQFATRISLVVQSGSGSVIFHNSHDE